MRLAAARRARDARHPAAQGSGSIAHEHPAQRLRMTAFGVKPERENARVAAAIWGSADYSNDAPMAQADPGCVKAPSML